MCCANEPFAILLLEPPAWRRHRGNVRTVFAGHRHRVLGLRARSQELIVFLPEQSGLLRHRQSPVLATVLALTRFPVEDLILDFGIG